MNTLTLIAGVISVMLGGLWLLQGLGVVHVPPILCFAECAPVHGPSLMWSIIGFLVVTAGVLAMFFSFRRRTRR